MPTYMSIMSPEFEKSSNWNVLYQIRHNWAPIVRSVIIYCSYTSYREHKDFYQMILLGRFCSRRPIDIYAGRCSTISLSIDKVYLI